MVTLAVAPASPTTSTGRITRARAEFARSSAGTTAALLQRFRVLTQKSAYTLGQEFQDLRGLAGNEVACIREIHYLGFGHQLFEAPFGSGGIEKHIARPNNCQHRHGQAA